MKDYAPQGVMYAVMGLDGDIVTEICQKASDKTGMVYAANFNSQKQTVISGEPKATLRAVEAAKVEGAKSIRLNTSGPFHTPIMKQAADVLKKTLDAVQFVSPTIKLISNVTACSPQSADEIPGILYRHMISPVLWRQSVENMVENGVENFVELGPKRTLCALIRHIAPEAKLCNVEDEKSLGDVLIKLGGGTNQWKAV
jgi:[acyl-carrier-protein] S-malonyltransferase